MQEFEKVIGTPLGRMRIRTSRHGVREVSFLSDDEPHAERAASHPLLRQCEAELQEYFRGKRTEFSVPLDLQGTEFERRVWASLSKIPFGKTVSYLQQARELGCPQSVRAVASANGRNPVAVLLPCHRVIGSNGSLTGYAGGLALKEKLLRLEGAQFTRF